MNSNNPHNGIDIKSIKSQFSVWRGQYGRWLPKHKNAKIVDLGCGYGGIVHWLHDRGYVSAEGIDINRELVDAGVGLGITNLNHGDAMSFLRGKRDFYDTIFLLDVLTSLSKEEVFDMIENIKVALKPDGILIVKVANAESPMAGRLRHADFKREISFSEASLKKLILDSGFSKVGAYPLRPVVHGLFSLLRYCLWRCIEVTLKLYRLVETGNPRGIFTQSFIAVAKK